MVKVKIKFVNGDKLELNEVSSSFENKWNTIIGTVKTKEKDYCIMLNNVLYFEETKE